MTQGRVYIPVSTSEYAEIHGVSKRTAQRRVSSIEGAYQARRTKAWRVPVTPKQYSEYKGVSESTARRHGSRAGSLLDWRDVSEHKETTAAERKAAANLAANLAKQGKSVNLATLEQSVKGLNNQQLKRAGGLKKPIDLTGDEWNDDDGNKLHYH